MDTLKKIQNSAFGIMCEIDRICKENNITYFLDSGTLLGAVRHKGFIPWDDDVDLVFTRENFEKFISCAKEQLKEPYELVTPDNIYKESFLDFVTRVIDKNTTINRPAEEAAFYNGRTDHVVVDIFCLDNCYDNKLRYNMLLLKLTCLHGLAMGHRLSIDYGKFGILQKVVIALLAKIGRHIHLKTIVRMYDNVSKAPNRKKCTYKYFSNYPIVFINCRMKEEWYSAYKYELFEGKEFPIPKCYDQILTELYGDYMTLPKEEDRVPQHSFF